MSRKAIRHLPNAGDETGQRDQPPRKTSLPHRRRAAGCTDDRRRCAASRRRHA